MAPPSSLSHFASPFDAGRSISPPTGDRTPGLQVDVVQSIAISMIVWRTAVPSMRCQRQPPVLCCVVAPNTAMTQHRTNGLVDNGLVENGLGAGRGQGPGAAVVVVVERSSEAASTDAHPALPHRNQRSTST